MAPGFYTLHPKQELANAIKSKALIGGLPGHGGAVPVLAGDETTWLGKGLSCHCNRAEDPLVEEEQARDLNIVVERGEANPMAMVCGSR
jgi:hypothetical protein